MKKLRNINITVTYSVELSDIELSDSVYDDLVALYDSGVYEIANNGKNEMECNVYGWIWDNIKEKDCYQVSYEIDDLETVETQE